MRRRPDYHGIAEWIVLAGFCAYLLASCAGALP